MTDDIQLLRRYAEEGTDAAFADLVRRHVDLVYSAALRYTAGDAHLAQMWRNPFSPTWRARPARSPVRLCLAVGSIKPRASLRRKWCERNGGE